MKTPFTLLNSARSLIIISPLFFIPLRARSQDIINPKWEVRAVWVTTAGGADWPKTRDAGEQQKSLIEIFDNLKARNFNTVFFQVRPRGNTFYKSKYEPWAAELTGILGKDPGWDPLEFAIDQAHKRGMELHAWFNVAKVSNGEMPPSSSPLHVVRRHPDWVQQYNGEWWVDMGRPDVRAYTEKLVMELVDDYDLDGIHFDYARYPGVKFNDRDTYREYGEGINRDDWRRNNITTFIQEMYRKITEAKPMMKVGSAPIGIYRSISGAQSGFAGYDALYQDARLWMRNKIEDYIVPQLYWDSGEQHFPKNDPDFRVLCVDWAENSYGRHVYTGIGAYRETVQKEISEQIIFSRSAGERGQAFFRYEDILALAEIGDEYKFPALIPPMPWKDSLPPLPPKNISITETSPGAHVIQWEPPLETANNNDAYNYVIYRSVDKDVDTDNPQNIVAIVPAPTTYYQDESTASLNSQVFYTVTALDRGNNESSSPSVKYTANQLQSTLEVQLLTKNIHRATLSQNYPNPFTDKTYIAYELEKRMPVQLIIVDQNGNRMFTLVEEVQGPGTYIVSFDAAKLSKGKHTYRLHAGTTVESRVMEAE